MAQILTRASLMLFRQSKNLQISSKFISATQIRKIQLQVYDYQFNDYKVEKNSFSLQAPEYFNFARDFIDQWAHAEQVGIRKTSLPAFWWVDGGSDTEIKLSFLQLSNMSKRVANALTGGVGLKRGDKVIVILPKVPQWWFINIACIRADITISPGTMLLRTSDIHHRLQLSGAKCIITSPVHAEMVEEASEGCENLSKIVVGTKNETRPGWLNFGALVEKASDNFECVDTKATDPMTIFFTSGTTGSPKMAEHTHVSYGLGHILTARYLLSLTPDSVLWNISDPGWAKCAWTCLLAPWIHGSCVFIYNSKSYDPLETIKVLSTYPVTHFCCPPTGMRIMPTEALKNSKFKALKYCVGAGEPVNPELVERWRNTTGLDLYEGYGQTETTLVCARYPCIPYKPGSMGKTSPGVDTRIVDDDGNVLEAGQEGNIAIRVKPNRPIGLFAGYVNEPERTAQSFRGDFYLLGDRGYMDEEDYFYFVGRSDDVINSAGYRIGPFEVESALLVHPAVQESAVVSSPDDIRGEVVKAFVTLVPEYKNADQQSLIKELQNHVKTVTAPYKYPRKIEFVDELPKTISGKIRRVELRNKEWGKD